jgi:hypothetical protein
MKWRVRRRLSLSSYQHPYVVEYKKWWWLFWWADEGFSTIETAKAHAQKMSTMQIITKIP